MFTKKEQSCQNNPEKSYTEKKAKHEPSDVHLIKQQDKLDYYKGKDGCMDEDDEDYKNKKRLEITVITQKFLEELLIAFGI